MRRIYLCSRVAKDAREVNEATAAFLERQGYSVFVPHREHPPELSIPDSEVYAKDLSEMRRADACVVVGRIGADCGFEVGWFERNGTPTVWYQPDVTKQWSPMLDRIFKCGTLEQVENFLKSTFVKESA